MRSLYFLVGMAVIGFVAANVDGMDVERPEAYKVLDELTFDKGRDSNYRTIGLDWPAIFHILDSMKGIINVNEYRTLPTFGDENGFRLLDIAVMEENYIAVNRLLEKYKANPNNLKIDESHILSLACQIGNPLIVKLLLKYGANPFIVDKWGLNSFERAKIGYNSEEILRILKQAVERRKQFPAAA